MARVASVAPQASSKARPSSTTVQRLRSSTEGTLKSWDEKISFFHFFLMGQCMKTQFSGECFSSFCFCIVYFMLFPCSSVFLLFVVHVFLWLFCSCVSVVLFLFPLCCFCVFVYLLLYYFTNQRCNLQYVTNIVQTTT